MVAELLRLRLRLVVNQFRGRPDAVAVRVLSLVVALVLIVLAYAGLRTLDGTGPIFAVRAIVGVGGFLSVAALLLPIVIVRRELMPARAFVGYPVRARLLIPVLAVFTLLGPAILVVPLLVAPAAAWRGADALPAGGCAVLLLLQTLLSLRIGAALGTWLRRRRALGRWVRALAVVLLIAAAVPPTAVLLTRAFLLVPDRIAPAVRVVLSIVRPIDASPAIDLSAGSPVGALWAAPGLRALGQGDRVGAALLVGLATVVVLALVWIAVVLLQLRPTWRRRRVPASRRVPGWFGRTPSTAAGAITARSFSYWIRDPRYRSVMIALPAIPILMLVALGIGGVPFEYGVLVPLPVLVLLVAWSTTHNDVAYDHTALWQHIAAATPGRADRVGRMWPPLVFGGVLVLVGSPLTAWGNGDWGILPAVFGVNAVVLLAGVGVGSGLSARFPYAAPRPGDGAFRHPQVAGSTGGGAQALSIALIGLAALPAIGAAGLYLFQVPGAPWSWIALAAGVVVGGATLVLGVVGGGRAFDRRGPELLAFTMRN
ncbi:hypothetical protein [Pseudolysinimonas sp.]|uniref:hypothetical protein n=1 Tax=Pseudolysinimonas sp. TaxID=2680009 RepID=UPI003F7D7CC7